VENLKGKWFVFALLPLLMLAIVPTILAEPAQKTPVTAITYNQVNGASETWTTEGGIMHTIAQRTGNVMLTIEGQAPIEGTISETVHAMVNTKTGKSVIQNFDSTWTFPGGSFQGVKQVRTEYSSPTVVAQVNQHVVFQGTGIYEGCTLMLSVDAPPFPPTYVGTMLVH
jgi:hypothetical protein